MSTVAVYGEALIDLISQGDDSYRPALGGSPYNVARALGRLDVDALFLAPFSEDAHGVQLRHALVTAGVRVADSPLSKRPTSLSLVTIGPDGQPTYVLYRSGVADTDVSSHVLACQLGPGIRAVHTGSLALLPDQIDKAIALLSRARELGITTSVDVNMRPKAWPTIDDYRSAVTRVFPLADILKLSDEDLVALGRSSDAERETADLLTESGAHLVVVTRGARGAVAKTVAGEAAQPTSRATQVVDTVGAGDCFQAALLAYLDAAVGLERDRLGTLRSSHLHPLLDFAQTAAGLNASRVGCQPPTRAEITEAIGPKSQAD